MFFYTNKAKLIQSKIVPGSSHSLWTAVKIAKNQNNNVIPKSLTLDGRPVEEHDASNAFASHFHDKIETIKSSTEVKDTVYNGKLKLLVVNRFFMSSDDIKECFDSLKSKNCECYDLIPLRIICDAKEQLLPALTELF